MTAAPPVVIISSRLDVPGGIERAVVNTANLLQENGHGVVLLVLDEFAESFYPLHRDVKLIRRSLDFGITEKGNVVTRKLRFYGHIKKLQAVLTGLKPSAIIATEYPFAVGAYLAARNTAAKIVAWEHHHFHWLGKSRFWQALCSRIYPRLAGVVCLNDAERKLFEEKGCNAVVVPNFVSRQTRSALDQKLILSIGWLINRKGFDRIPAIAEKVFAKHPDWRWVIIGTGEEDTRLQKLISHAGLENRVTVVPPLSPDLRQAYLSASLYVMTSRFECFPMVLLEAASHGVPCVSFDCPTGPSFIIKDGEDGFLVEGDDVDGMARQIVELIEDEKKREAFGEAAFENVGRFAPEKIYALWKELLAE